MSAQTCLTVQGDLTGPKATDLMPQLLAALRQGGNLYVDLSAAERVDAVGLQMLLMARSEARDRGIVLRLIGLRLELRELMTFYGMQDLMLLDE